MLTDLQVSAAEAREKDYKLADANGLYLFVMRSGVKSWRMKYRFGGKERRLTFGRYPDVSLEEARARRDDARDMLRQQIDPNSLRQQRPLTGIDGKRTQADPDPAHESAGQSTTDPAAMGGVSSGERLHNQLAVREPVEPKSWTADSEASTIAVEQRALFMLTQAEAAAEAAAHSARSARRVSLLAVFLLGLTLIVRWW